ncbi:sigma-70 family RNA polymerase sigma factor [Thalassomonas viridans]|uniref:Sigma-70 family RNA polymerase sigma factor n=1 Tax=Thalassomonas viridans TaxID=137584 RepID=A0AAE9Z3A6_9GAMM|nr:sigma-70 family RNA polymerase sigma factor [Thalassomonas viridans]WDE05285.1 sigma-70 family RNA polymerase sigma factor [Thalassomonas viridans]
MARKESESVEFSAEAILKRIKEGDRSAERALVRQYWQGLHFILLRKCRDPELTKDILQDSFIVIINNARENLIENPATLASYIRKVGVHLLIAHFRKEKRRATTPAQDIQIYSDDKIPGLFQHLSAQDILQKVQQLIDEMPVQRDKELLRDFFVYGKDKEQICTAMELSCEHFDKVLYRARQRLKQLVQFELGPDSYLPDRLEAVLYIAIALALLNSAPLSPETGQAAIILILMRELQNT